MGKISSNISKFLIILIGVYKIIISPFLRKNCKFQVTCSDYSIIAIQNFGVLKGLYMTLIRLVSCRTFFCKKVRYKNSCREY